MTSSDPAELDPQTAIMVTTPWSRGQVPLAARSLSVENFVL